VNEATLPGGKRTILNLVFLAAHALFAVLGAAVAAWAITQIKVGATLEDRQFSEEAYLITIAAHLILFCLGGIAFLMWLHRTYSNAQMLGSTNSSPGMVTFSFFIPFVQLVRPYQGIQEIWRNSETRPGVAPKNSALILAWWLSFLAWESIFFFILDKMPEETLPSLNWWTGALIGDLFGAIAGALGAWMVFSIRRRQKDEAREQAKRAFSIPATPMTYPA
jgi:hypothetical protein